MNRKNDELDNQLFDFFKNNHTDKIPKSTKEAINNSFKKLEKNNFDNNNFKKKLLVGIIVIILIVVFAKDIINFLISLIPYF